jgi:hypothetical protein
MASFVRVSTKSTTQCIAPLAPIPIHGNDCLRNHAISLVRSELRAISDLHADRFLCTVESGFGQNKDVAKGEDLLDLCESTPICNESECKLYCVLNAVQWLRWIPSLRLGWSQLSGACYPSRGHRWIWEGETFCEHQPVWILRGGKQVSLSGSQLNVYRICFNWFRGIK